MIACLYPVHTKLLLLLACLQRVRDNIRVDGSFTRRWRRRAYYSTLHFSHSLTCIVSHCVTPQTGKCEACHCSTPHLHDNRSSKRKVVVAEEWDLADVHSLLRKHHVHYPFPNHFSPSAAVSSFLASTRRRLLTSEPPLSRPSTHCSLTLALASSKHSRFITSSICGASTFIIFTTYALPLRLSFTNITIWLESSCPNRTQSLNSPPVSFLAVRILDRQSTS